MLSPTTAALRLTGGFLLSFKKDKSPTDKALSEPFKSAATKGNPFFNIETASGKLSRASSSTVIDLVPAEPARASGIEYNILFACDSVPKIPARGSP